MTEPEPDELQSCDDCHDEDCPECECSPCCCDDDTDKRDSKLSQRSESKESSSRDEAHRIYREQVCSSTNLSLPVNSVGPALKANAYRTGAVFTNIGQTVLLIRLHPSNLDPVLPGSTGILQTLKPNASYVMDNNTPRRIIQSNICVVNTDTNIIGALSIGETIKKG